MYINLFNIFFIILVFFFEGYFLYTKKRWKEFSIVSITLSLALYLTLADKEILPKIDFISTIDNLFRPLTSIMSRF